MAADLIIVMQKKVMMMIDKEDIFSRFRRFRLN